MGVGGFCSTRRSNKNNWNHLSRSQRIERIAARKYVDIVTHIRKPGHLVGDEDDTGADDDGCADGTPDFVGGGSLVREGCAVNDELGGGIVGDAVIGGTGDRGVGRTGARDGEVGGDEEQDGAAVKCEAGLSTS